MTCPLVSTKDTNALDALIAAAGVPVKSEAPKKTLQPWLAGVDREVCQGKSQNMGTIRETNIAPENRPSQKETSIPTIHFQVPC